MTTKRDETEMGIRLRRGDKTAIAAAIREDINEDDDRLFQLLASGAINTTMHGLPRIYKAPSVSRKIAWVLILLFGLGMMLWQVSKAFIKFTTWPVESSVYVDNPGHLPLPAITFCNMNPVKRSALGSVQSLKNLYQTDGEEEPNIHQATEHSNVSKSGTQTGEAPSDSSDTQYTDYDSDDYDEDYGEDEDSMERELFQNTMSMLSQKQKMHLGYNISDMLINCTFKGQRCGLRNFSIFPNEVYGNCFTFNTYRNNDTSADINPKTLAIISKVGPLNALELTLFIRQNEYMSMTEEAGVRVIIHNQTEAPFPENRGFSVPTGQSTYVGLHRRVDIRVGDPYGKCGEVEGVNMYESFRKYLGYSEEACRRTCYQSRVFDTCGCGDPYYPLHSKAVESLQPDNNTRPCISSNESICMNGVLDLFAYNKLNCSEWCPHPCYEAMHDVTISTAVWPSDVIEGDFLMTLKRKGLLKGYGSSEEQQNYVSKNFLKIKVFFADLSVVTTATKPSYQSTDLLGDLGGLIGLYLGLSVITIFEFVELVVDMCAWCVVKRPNSTNAKGKSMVQ